MAIAHVQSTKVGNDASSATIALAYGSNNTAASLGLAIVAFGTSAAVDPETPTVADTNGNTWTLIDVAWESFVQWHFAWYYAKNLNAGANTVTATNAGSVARVARALIIVEYSGVDTSAPLHKHAVTTTTTFTTGADGTVGPSITPTTDGCLIVGGLGSGQAATVNAPGTGFTERQFQNSATSRLEIEDLVQSTAAAITPKWTVAAANHGSLFSAAFLAAAGGASTVSTRMALTGAGG